MLLVLLLGLPLGLLLLLAAGTAAGCWGCCWLLSLLLAAAADCLRHRLRDHFCCHNINRPQPSSPYKLLLEALPFEPVAGVLQQHEIGVAQLRGLLACLRRQ